MVLTNDGKGDSWWICLNPECGFEYPANWAEDDPRLMELVREILASLDEAGA